MEVTNANELLGVTEKIIQTVEGLTDLFLIGETKREHESGNIFSSQSIRIKAFSRFYFIVLVNDCVALKNTDLQERIESCTLNLDQMVVLVLPIGQFRVWFWSGQEFANSVVNKGTRLYTQGNWLDSYEGPYAELESELEAERLHTAAMVRVHEFMAGAELYKLRRQYLMGLFMLHQCLEQLLSAYFKKRTGLRLNTHNIDRLLKYCSMFGEDLRVFNLLNANDQRLQRLLKNSYIAARYNETQKISEVDFDVIKKRIEDLISKIKGY